MKQKQEKWAIFWCDLLSPIIYSEIHLEQTHQNLRELSSKAVLFPDGELKKPSLSTLKRKLARYRENGFHGLYRKSRNDIGKIRVVPEEVIAKAIELKKEQPYRSDRTINSILRNKFGIMIARSTLYSHFKEAGATRLKLGIVKKKVRGRWTRDNTHDFWQGDFEEGPYVIENDEIVPTYLSAFIDVHSRYVVEARYYFRQNLDVLIDSLVRALSKHGAPKEIYVDNAKVYHSLGLKMACHIMKTRLRYRPAGEPETGGLIERFFSTVQGNFEKEVRAEGKITLDQLNRNFSAWLEMAYHNQIHSEIKTTPEKKMEAGLKYIRQVNTNEVLAAFMKKIKRTVNRTFSDVQINNRYFQTNDSLRGDKVLVGIDPFSKLDTVEIYSLKGGYLGLGVHHFREPNKGSHINKPQGKPKYSYLGQLRREHAQQLDKQIKGIDFRKAVQSRPWSFQEFVNTIAGLLGEKAGLSSFNTGQLESLKKVFNQSLLINKPMVKKAFENAAEKSTPFIIYELKQIIKQNKEAD
ncbi:MAG: DDE-type integrase/transposase/recombinase [Desulfobacula sp.]|nr:DDE-type integrase/transposase/recombinase [Desulfobacula sp.]